MTPWTAMTPLHGYVARDARYDDRCAADEPPHGTRQLIGGAAAVMAAEGRVIRHQYERSES